MTPAVRGSYNRVMKKKLRVNPQARTLHVPRELVEEGFSGDLDAYLNSFTLVIARSGANLRQISQSLDIVQRDIQLRLEEQAGNKG